MTRASGARHSSIRFVAGEHDPMTSRAGVPHCSPAGQRFNYGCVRGRDATEIPRGDGSFGGFAECCGHRCPPWKLAVHENSPPITATIKKFLLGA